MADGNGTGRVVNLQDYPASVITQQATDPARLVDSAVPNYGRPAVPHIFTLQGRRGTISRVYRPPDEAIRNSLEDARYMRNECGIMECLEGRQRGTALLNWHLIPEDEEDPKQKEIVSTITEILERMDDFLEYRRNLLEALWFGKYAIEHRWKWEWIRGKKYQIVKHWIPIQGDKLVFRYDDGTFQFDDQQVGIRIGAGYMTHRFESFVGHDRNKVEPTDQGLAYFLDAWERDLMIAIHKHIIEDGPWEDPLAAGSIHGLGIRHRIYWTWYSMQETLSWLMEYLERTALGIEIWYYPMHNEVAEEKTRKAAEERIGGGRSIVLVPKPQGEDSQMFGVEHIEPGLGGVAEMRSIITEYFGWKIKRYILGQILTSEAEGTGLGSGVADAHLATYLDIVRYDATKLSETITRELVNPIKALNWPGHRNCHIRFVIDTEAPEVEKKLEAWRQAFDMGAKLKSEDVLSLIGASAPEEGDEVLQNPAYTQQQQPGGFMPGQGSLGGNGQQQFLPFSSGAGIAEASDGMSAAGDVSAKAQFGREKYANWSGPHEGPRGGTYWENEKGDKHYGDAPPSKQDAEQPSPDSPLTRSQWQSQMDQTYDDVEKADGEISELNTAWKSVAPWHITHGENRGNFSITDPVSKQLIGIFKTYDEALEFARNEYQSQIQPFRDMSSSARGKRIKLQQNYPEDEDIHNEKQKRFDSIPPAVHDRLERKLDSLRSINDSLSQGETLDKKFAGGTRYRDEVWDKVSAGYSSTMQEIEKLRSIIEKKGFDFDGFLSSKGGIPDLIYNPESTEQHSREITTKDRGGPDPFVEVQEQKQAYQAPAKMTQEAANYRHDTKTKQRCGNCEHWDDGKCARVSGDIEAKYTCDYWFPIVQRHQKFDESKHPRGQPDNAGQFAPKEGGEETEKKPRRLQKATHSGKGKEYKLTLSDGTELPDHLKNFRLPPAWTDVQVDTDPDADLVATGFDAKGRRQSVYSAKHSMRQAAAKFSRIQELKQKLSDIERENREAGGEEADVLSLIMATGVRPGSERDTGAEKQAYGATTLLGQHVVQDESGNVRLQFVGKKGKDLDIPVADPDVATMLLDRKQRMGDDGKLFQTTDKRLRDHVNGLDGGSFSPKDFRTLKGTTIAAESVRGQECCTSEKEYKSRVKEVAKVVSDQLGNTPTIALQSYIDPTVFSKWRPAA